MHVGYVLYVNILFSPAFHHFVQQYVNHMGNTFFNWKKPFQIARLELQGRLFPQIAIPKKLNFDIHTLIQVHCHKLAVLFLLDLFVYLVGVFPPLELKRKTLIL